MGRHVGSGAGSSAAMGALEYPKKNSRNDNKEELYFSLLYFTIPGLVLVMKYIYFPLEAKQGNTGYVMDTGN